jgi:hypothetical protein
LILRNRKVGGISNHRVPSLMQHPAIRIGPEASPERDGTFPTEVAPYTSLR